MEITSSQLDGLKNTELELLRAFIEVCDKLDLKYFVLGGTLLGAVRHQGFIPWDDDIDVGMKREDYEIFLAEGQKYLPDGYFIQTHITDPDYPCNFAKIRNSNTTFVEDSVRERKINHGVYIDIFPLDFYPDSGKRWFSVKKLLMTLRITDAYSVGGMKLKTKLLRCVSRVLYPSVKGAVAKREQLFKSVHSGEYIANHCGAWGKKEIVPGHWYGDGAKLSFEGIEITAPAEYHLWLTQVYGDYMKLPPEDKRIPHHYVDMIDLEKPYTYYTERK